MKIIVFGLVFNGPDSYLRGAWNIIDIFVVIVGILVLVLQSVLDSNNIIWLRAFRAMRSVQISTVHYQHVMQFTYQTLIDYYCLQGCSL